MTAFYTNAASDNFRTYKSKPLSGAVTAGTYGLIRIPRYAFVTGVWALVVTACNVTDMTIGWAGNLETAVPAGFISSDILDAGTTGLKCAVKDTAVASVGKYFNAGIGEITATFSTNMTSGKFIVFCQYSVIM